MRRWCASCPECQLVNPPAVPRAPLRPLPLVEAPFDRIGMDITSPLQRSAQGYRFVLVLIDYATGYPEAIPLREHPRRALRRRCFMSYCGWESEKIQTNRQALKIKGEQIFANPYLPGHQFHVTHD